VGAASAHLSADFERSAEPFEIGSTPDYALDIDDGTYRITATRDPGSPLTAFAPFRPNNVEITATVVALDAGDATLPLDWGAHLPPGTILGTCSLVSNTHGYMLVVYQSGYQHELATANGRAHTSVKVSRSGSVASRLCRWNRTPRSSA
jgi:hypothetical protein